MEKAGGKIFDLGNKIIATSFAADVPSLVNSGPQQSRGLLSSGMAMQ